MSAAKMVRGSPPSRQFIYPKVSVKYGGKGHSFVFVNELDSKMPAMEYLGLRYLLLEVRPQSSIQSSAMSQVSKALDRQRRVRM